MPSLQRLSACPPAPALRRLGRHATPATALAALQADGALVIEGALQPAVLSILRAQLDPWFDAARCGSGPFFGRATRRFSGLFAKAPATEILALHPLVQPLLETALKGPPDNPACDSVELNLTQAIGIEPGEPAQVLHRDDELWPAPRDRELMANVLWTLDDFTAENGATRLVPGSHRWARDRYPGPEEVVSATAPAGSAIVWLGSLLHGGGANRTTRLRRGVVVSYRLGWLAPAERLLLSTPPAVAAALPEPLQRLIGYQLHRPNLGWVEGRDPIEWLRGATGDLAQADDNLRPADAERLAALLASSGEAA